MSRQDFSLPCTPSSSRERRLMGQVIPPSRCSLLQVESQAPSPWATQRPPPPNPPINWPIQMCRQLPATRTFQLFKLLMLWPIWGLYLAVHLPSLVFTHSCQLWMAASPSISHVKGLIFKREGQWLRSLTSSAMTQQNICKLWSA